MEENCLASELVHIKIILLVLSNAFFKTPKSGAFTTLKKILLKTSKIVLMYSNSLARQFSSMFHAKCLLPRLDKFLPVRSCLQNFYQCTNTTTISILANKVRPFVDRRSDDTILGAGTFSWQDSDHSWKAGPGEVMTVESLFLKLLACTREKPK